MNLYFALPLLPGGNLEWIIVIMAALMIFGSNLPEVALRVVAHVMRIRRAIAKMWQDTGLEDELRRVRRDIELSIPREADFKVKDPGSAGKRTNEARAAAIRAREAAERNARNQAEAAAATQADELSEDPDAHRSGEFALEPAAGIVGDGDISAAEALTRDQIPGADRRESTTYYEEEPPGGDAPPAAPPKPVPAEESQQGLEGDHFGAGVQPPPGETR